MPNILIIGNSLASVAAIEEIRRQDAESKITLFCPEGVLPYDRNLLPALLTRDIKEANLLARPAKFFADNRVEVVLKENLARVSTKRRQITTENKTHFSFDKLLITDLGQVKLPAVKGHHKKGVFDIARLTAVKELAQYLPYADNIVLVVTTFAGLDTACALKRLGKEVLIVSPTDGLLGELIDEESGILLKQILEAKGIRIAADNAVEEVLGDAEAKAVRLKSGKVMAAEAVIFDNPAADFKVLADTALLENGELHTGEFFNTGLPEVYVCDAGMGIYDFSAEETLTQGRCAAANLMATGSAAYQPPVFLRTFGSKICDGFCGGTTRLQEGGREHMKFDGPQNVYKKIFLFNDCLAGAVCFNALQDKEKIQDALAQNMALAGKEEEFLQ